MNKLHFILILLGFTLPSYAQFGRLADRVVNNVSRRIENKAADMLAEAIARKVYKAMDKATEDVLQKTFEDSLGTNKVDYNKMGRAYGEFLSGMNEALDKVPPTYQFDLICDVKITDSKDKNNILKMYYSENGDIIGNQTEEKNKVSTIVWDLKNEILVSFSDDKGKKTGQVLPSMTRIVVAYAKDEVERKKEDFKITKNVDKKTIAGYACVGHEFETSDAITRFYVAENFPLNYKDAYSKFFQQFTPAGYVDDIGIEKGFVLMTKTTDKKSKKTTTYEVVKVQKEKYAINKIEYDFPKKK